MEKLFTGIYIFFFAGCLTGAGFVVQQVLQTRVADHDVLPCIKNRHSSRAMSGEKVSETELKQLFEAARWAPSAYNIQPWRFIYGYKGSVIWDILFNTLVPFNQQWVKNGSVLLLVLSYNFDYKARVNPTHSFDTAAAWQNIALQGCSMGLVVTGMSGFDYNKVKQALAIPEGYTIELMVVVGKPGDIHALPEVLRKKEVPSGRKKIEEFIFTTGKLPA